MDGRVEPGHGGLKNPRLLLLVTQFVGAGRFEQSEGRVPTLTFFRIAG
jgi:hypothetical protein